MHSRERGSRRAVAVSADAPSCRGHWRLNQGSDRESERVTSIWKSEIKKKIGAGSDEGHAIGNKIFRETESMTAINQISGPITDN